MKEFRLFEKAKPQVKVYPGCHPGLVPELDQMCGGCLTCMKSGDVVVYDKYGTWFCTLKCYTLHKVEGQQ